VVCGGGARTRLTDTTTLALLVYFSPIAQPEDGPIKGAETCSCKSYFELIIVECMYVVLIDQMYDVNIL
jgi:hypothetical protein